MLTALIWEGPAVPFAPPTLACFPSPFSFDLRIMPATVSLCVFTALLAISNSTDLTGNFGHQTLRNWDNVQGQRLYV
jgi:hypothetical protein